MILIVRWLTFGLLMIYWIIYFKGGKSLKTNSDRLLKGFNRVLIKVIFIFLVLLIIGQLLVLLIPEMPILIHNPYIVLCASILIIITAFISVWTRFYWLGKYWHCNVVLDQQGSFVSGGLYRIVRHPLYSLALIRHLLLIVVFSTWWYIILAVAISISYIVLAKYEDTALQHSHAAYIEYQNKTHYIIMPGIF